MIRDLVHSVWKTLNRENCCKWKMALAHLTRFEIENKKCHLAKNVNIGALKTEGLQTIGTQVKYKTQVGDTRAGLPWKTNWARLPSQGATTCVVNGPLRMPWPTMGTPVCLDIIPTPPDQNVATALLMWAVKTLRNDATVADVWCSCNMRKFVRDLLSVLFIRCSPWAKLSVHLEGNHSLEY